VRTLVRDQRGFSLAEVVIAVAVVAVVLLAATQGTIWMAKNNQQLAVKSSQATSNAIGSRGFASAFETASVAVSYEHMPVWNNVGPGGAGNCTWRTDNLASFLNAGPCTAQLAQGNLFATGATGAGPTGITVPTPALSGASLLGGVKYVEFFRDDDATVTDTIHPFAYPGANALVQKTLPLSDLQLSQIQANNNPFFTAWPLVFNSGVTPNSAPGLVATYPLLVMQSSSTTDPLLFSNITFDYTRLLGDKSARHALMQVTNVNDVPKVGTIYLIYDTYDPTQYVFQYASDVQDCTTPAGATVCEAAIDEANGADSEWSASAPPANQKGMTYLPANGNTTNECGAGFTQFLCPNPGAPGTPPGVSLAQWFQAGPRAGVGATTSGDTVHYFAIQFEPIPNSQLPATFYPASASLFGTSTSLLWFNSSGTQGGQAPGTFPFPFLTEFASLFDTTSKPLALFAGNFAEYSTNGTGTPQAGAGVDIRVLAHYYNAPLQSTNPSSGTSIGASAQLVAVPVTLQSFNLYGPISATCLSTGNPSGSFKCSTFNFVVNTLTKIGATPTQTVLMDHLPLAGITGAGGTTGAFSPQGAVIIARQLGGSSFQMMYYSSSTVSVSAL
jgi:prepilin-type N-terminal cleavage/methylation domain-containing protein